MGAGGVSSFALPPTSDNTNRMGTEARAPDLNTEVGLGSRISAVR